ncbi:hypothetical protein ACHAQA_005147 [Verticillium albo-atrum]
MGKLSYIDAGPGKPLESDSMWSILQTGYNINPNATALISPAQPSDLLHKLVGPAAASPLAAPLTSLSSRLRRTYARSTCFTTSFMLPTPSFGDCLSWSFAQLRRGAARIASVIEESGVKPGSTMVVFLPSKAEWTLMMWVSALKCYTLVTLDPAIVEPGQEQLLDAYMAKVRPSLVIASSQSAAAAVDKSRSRLDGSDSLFVGITVENLKTPQENWTSLPEIAARKFPEGIEIAPPAADNLDRVAMIIFTSGTSSGKPKGAVRTVRDLLRPLTGSELPPPLRPPTVLINTKAAQSLAPSLLYSAWYSGNAGALTGGNFTPATTISSMMTCRPITAALYTHTVDDIRNHPDYNAEKVSSLRFLLVIGAVATTETLKRAQETFPKAKIYASYSMTEAAGMCGWKGGVPAVKDVPSYRGVVSCGTAMPGIKMKIVDEQGKTAKQGELGVLHLSGDFVATGYIDENGADSYYEEGGERWYITGDCAVLDSQNRLYILARWDMMIRKDVALIAPATVENAIKKHHPESGPIVFGMTVPGTNSEGIYAILPKAVKGQKNVKDLVAKELGESHRPAGVVDLAQLGLTDWPLTMVGKLSIVDMRRILTQHLASEKALVK